MKILGEIDVHLNYGLPEITSFLRIRNSDTKYYYLFSQKFESLELPLLTEMGAFKKENKLPQYSSNRFD